MILSQQTKLSSVVGGNGDRRKVIDKMKQTYDSDEHEPYNTKTFKVGFNFATKIPMSSIA
jgi:hypothetical protein